MMNHVALLVGGSLVGAVLFLGCGGGGAPKGASPTVDHRDFGVKIDNPLLPLSSLNMKLFEGEERDPDTGQVVKTRLESRLLPRVDRVAGVPVIVIEDKAYQNGELIESTLDYFAQHRDGSVYYFGEQVDEYEGGKVVGHSGQWLAGEGRNEPGILMPAHPTAGLAFQQEYAPGVAEDRATVVAVDQSITTPAGSFTGCIKTEDSSPLDPNVTEFKYYCPAVGLVREELPDGHLDLISYR